MKIDHGVGPKILLEIVYKLRTSFFLIRIEDCVAFIA